MWVELGVSHFACYQQKVKVKGFLVSGKALSLLQQNAKTQSSRV